MRFFHTGKLFPFLQKRGFNITVSHFYSPIPDLADLAKRPEVWDVPSSLPGVAMNLKGQRTVLKDVIKPYIAELRALIDTPTTPPGYTWDNHAFGPASAFMLYGFIRTFKSKRVVEIGSGFSTAVSALASLQNEKSGIKTEFTAVEPYPNKMLQQGIPGLKKLVRERVEKLPNTFFETLKSGDILFIDSSHVAKTGSDVTHLFLEILPRLNPGVIVHVHDIFFPYEYPKPWVMKQNRFWNEQYLLQAFLSGNSQFEVLYSGSYMHANALTDLEKTIPKIEAVTAQENYFSSSFWFRRLP